MFDVSICICTFRRPDLLRHLLGALEHQSSAARMQIVVVDNDPLQSAAPVLREMRERLGVRLKTLALAIPNISLARNAAVQAADGAWIALLDDDERPVADWLARLLNTQKQFEADVVFGPVLAEYAEGVADWLRRGGYFERRRLPSGAAVTQADARSGNVLLRRSALLALCGPEQQGPFDAAFGKTGGEDSILFRRLLDKGASLVWCDEAPVYEWIPAERGSAQWLLQRSFRTGQLFLRAELHTLRGMAYFRQAGWLGGRAVVQGMVASLLALTLLPFSRLKAFSWLRIAASQCGKLSFLLGKKTEFYGA